jgi:3-deoxy-D-manno-octulosonic-acid transferase
MKWIYLVSIYLFRLVLEVGYLFSQKAKSWIEGRKNWKNKLQSHSFPPGEKRVWIHCASLGEFEQGRPLIEKLKAENPSVQIILSFFSPSGYEIRKDYPMADLVCYLPLDTPRNSHLFLEILQPDLAVFVKYEFWYFYLNRLHQKGIPTILVSALFRSDQHFFKPYGSFFKRMLFFFDHIFVQNKSSAQLLAQASITHHSLAGDTRVDRVLQLAEEKKTFPRVQAFTGQAPVLVAGSTWPPDEELLLPFLTKDLPAHWKCIIAPHEIDEGHIQKIEQGLSGQSVRYALLSEENKAKDHRFLIIDNIGMLASLYQYGKIAYIGGGFGRGIHNTLEPITFGLPVLFGPNYHKFEEALSLVKQGGAFPIESYEQLKQAFEQLTKPEMLAQASQQARQYILSNQGATEQIYYFLKKKKYL